VSPLEYEREKGLPRAWLTLTASRSCAGDVCVHHAEIGIEHNDAGGQRADEIGGLEVSNRRGRKRSTAMQAPGRALR
jgi:hypothetical protein